VRVAGGEDQLHEPSAAGRDRLIGDGLLERSPLNGTVAAISAGIVGGVPLLDLDYSEDSTAERTPLSRAHLDDLLALAAGGIERLRAAQDQAVASADG